jgi:hypothetical protein
MSHLVACLLALCSGLAQAQFDHRYAAWDGLLNKHVQWLPDNRQSRVDYAGLQRDRAELNRVLEVMSAVPKPDFDRWPREQRMALLINAYNAFTIDLILTRYPDLTSIKDLGTFVQSPWKKRFFILLGDKRDLDWIEHDQLRALYKDPRVHAALNCASVGCPALRNEAFTALKLEAQLDDGLARFLGDRSRNRVRDGRLEVSAIFKWFKEDFESGKPGGSRLEDLFAKHANLLSERADEQSRLRARTLPVTYLDYDWSLNAVGR